MSRFGYAAQIYVKCAEGDRNSADHQIQALLAEVHATHPDVLIELDPEAPEEVEDRFFK